MIEQVSRRGACGYVTVEQLSWIFYPNAPRNPGDVVLSPFMGIGSEGVISLKLKRKFLGIELKESYWRQACRYLEAQDRQDDLFAREIKVA